MLGIILEIRRDKSVYKYLGPAFAFDFYNNYYKRCNYLYAYVIIKSLIFISISTAVSAG